MTDPGGTVPWIEPGSIQQARSLQEELSERVDRNGELDNDSVRFIAGVDASISRDKTHMIGAISLLRWPQLTVEDVSIETLGVAFPYVPGYLSFREVPVLLKAAEHLTHFPDLVIVDGQGIAHPRRLGLASHLGLVTGWRTIGCAKSRLIGECEEPGRNKGAFKPCLHKDEEVARLVRTRDGVKPVWISTGHGISLENAVKWVLRTAIRYRLPEPIRVAHKAAGRFRRSTIA
ncbi:deoxyribonuclease V [bacterium]|nr:deoxyribonuclease V [bacterium]